MPEKKENRKKKGTAYQRSPDSSRFHALECIPVKHPQVAEQADGTGELRLTYKVQVRPWFHGVVKKITGSRETIINRKLVLDLLGASVWRRIDGRKSVRQIIDEFQAEHQLNRREAEISVTAFFRELGKRGLLAMRERE
ncbi:MAG: PqqD family protein [Desulfobulbaceae bacterium]|nr:PqqD family protein [Desulfobulbaceae bacterium]